MRAPKTIVYGKRRATVQTWRLSTGPLDFLVSRNYVPKFDAPKRDVGRFSDGHDF